MASLADVVELIESSLQYPDMKDYSGASNGLQLENSGEVTSVAVAVDANLWTIQKSIEAGADFLLVHHGLAWTPIVPLTGNRYRMIKSAMDARLAIYSCHLPLDADPVFGNNALLAKALGFKEWESFFEENGVPIGVRVFVDCSRDELQSRLAEILGTRPTLLPGGGDYVHQLGIVSGGCGRQLVRAKDEGVDAFLTGEGQQDTFTSALEHGINVFYGGHYLTETFGVKALGEHVAQQLGIPFTFIDVPTGL